MKNTYILTYFNYLYIVIVLLWKPLQGTILTVDGKGRILLALTIIAFIANCNKRIFRQLISSKPIIFWFIWCIYSVINTYIKGYTSNNIPFLYFAINEVICPCIMMAACASEFLKNATKFLRLTLFVFLVYAFIGAFVMDIGYVAMEEGATSVNTLGNALALNVMMIIFFAGLLYCREEISLKIAVILILFAIGIVVISATRKALGAGIIMIVALIFSHLKWNFANSLKLLLPIMLVYGGLNFVISNTQMGERLQEMEEVSDRFTENNSNPFLKAMGDRAPQYILGTQLFTENPITGVGLMNFERKSGYAFRLHTEYMVQICECGIIGCVIFVAFYISVVKRLIRRIKFGPADKRNVIMMLGAMGALFFIYLTAWAYSISTYFAVLGTIIGYSFSNKQVK